MKPPKTPFTNTQQLRIQALIFARDVPHDSAASLPRGLDSYMRYVEAIYKFLKKKG